MPFVIYGSYGYTGGLIAAEAARRGLDAVLAGRDPVRLAAQSEALGLDYRVFDLDDLRLVQENIRDADCVLHCAGPFVHTATPMVDACLAARVHYLDITGEIAVFEALAARDAEARAAGVMLLPGAGFDVVPSDCLARHVAARLPEATRLELAFEGAGGVSHGTASTALLGLGRPGAVRRGGRLVPVPLGHAVRRVDFGDGPVSVAAIPWGDLSTAWRSTGVPDIVTYMRLPRRWIRALRLVRGFGWLLRRRWLRRWLQARVDATVTGPDAEARARGRSRFWGRAETASGEAVEARLETPEAYRLTALAALHLVVKVLGGCARPGFQTPAGAYGADLVLELDGVRGFLP